MVRLAQNNTPPDGWQASGGAGEQRGRRARQHYSTRPADVLLPRLEAVKETGPGRWCARCPAHDDKHPSLTVKETDDGTLLVRCWAGCPASDIVAAAGMELSDLSRIVRKIAHRSAVVSGGFPATCLRLSPMRRRLCFLRPKTWPEAQGYPSAIMTD